MRDMNNKLLVAALVLLAAAACEAKRDFSLYQPIIDRAPFGPPPDDPTVDPGTISAKDEKAAAAAGEEMSKQQQELMKSVTVCAINLDPDGTVMVGFVDNSNSKSPRTYYVRDGETRDGWAVSGADPVEKKVTLEKDSVKIECVLGKAAGSSGPAGAAAQPAASAGSVRSGAFQGRSSLLSGGPMKSRRQMREEQEMADRQARQKAAEEAKNAREEAAREREAARAALEEEREATRQSLISIQEELKRQREERRQRDAEEKESEDGDDDDEND